CVAQLRTTDGDTPCLTSVPFDPVWALPTVPLLANKRYTSVRFIASALVQAEPPAVPLRISRQQIHHLVRWCSYVLDASKKGLAVDPNTPELTALWRRYADRAR